MACDSASRVGAAEQRSWQRTPAAAPARICQCQGCEVVAGHARDDRQPDQADEGDEDARVQRQQLHRAHRVGVDDDDRQQQVVGRARPQNSHTASGHIAPCAKTSARSCCASARWCRVGIRTAAVAHEVRQPQRPQQRGRRQPAEQVRTRRQRPERGHHQHHAHQVGGQRGTGLLERGAHAVAVVARRGPAGVAGGLAHGCDFFQPGGVAPPRVIWPTASTACVRDETLSARSTAATWSLTVSTDRPSRARSACSAGP